MGDKEFGRFLYVAMGLANELKYRCAQTLAVVNIRICQSFNLRNIQENKSK